MFCKKCGNEIKNGEKKCSNCGKNVKSKIWIIGILLIIILIIATIAIILIKNNNEILDNSEDDNQGFISSSGNAMSNGASSTSFANFKADDTNFSEIQSTIIDYFDNNYFDGVKAESFQKYPQVYNDAKIETNIEVMKVLKSTDEEFEVIAVQGGTLAADIRDGSSAIVRTGYTTIEQVPENELLILRGKQLNKRLVKGDVVRVYGRYKGVDNFDIDGTNYVLPILNSINLVQYSERENDNYRFNFNTIKSVAEYIFGKNIKISTPAIGEDYDSETSYTLSPFYKITLDNQSNVNFSIFNMYRKHGWISYNEESKNTDKQLFVGADFQHYLVTTYDTALKHAYVEYFDKDLNKLFSREFDLRSNESSGPFDYTASQLAIVIDNDLHLIDLKTGEDVFEPIIVGNKTKVNMMNDGIILVGDDNKDTIMKVGYDGKIIFRTNGDTEFIDIYSAQTQIVNGKMVVKLTGTVDDNGFPHTNYLVLNSDGSIETSTN